MMTTGYAHPEYARSLAEYGTPVELPLCGGWILERPVPGCAATDAMGCYPLFVCRDWSRLRADIEGLGSRLVSLSLVADPFGDYVPEELRACFDIVRPFKQHVVVDMSRPRNEVVSGHHRKIARRALRRLEVKRCESPHEYLDDWARLYGCLIRRHRISGISAFSYDAFSRQLRIPGASLFVAIHQGRVVGAALAYEQGDVVYAHLTAFDETGYELSASYALKWVQMDYYAGRARWLDLGGVPGVDDAGSDGLRRFKEGWSSQTRPAYFCGRVLNHELYDAIAGAKSVCEDDYFPAYRRGEFAGESSTAEVA